VQTVRIGVVVRFDDVLAHQLGSQRPRVAAESGEHHAPRVLDRFGGELLHAVIVEERHRAIGVKPVVARMRIAVEQPFAVERSEDVAVDDLGPLCADVGRRPLRLGPGKSQIRSIVSTRCVHSTGTTSGTWMNGWPR